jgi:hypothetical protein
MIDFGKSKSKKDDRTGVTQWRVVEKTGNCCENYLLATAMGRLMDFGGCYVNYTDDLGETWSSVRTIEPQNNGEGALVGGVGGDVLGVTWDPYTGDRVWAYKYTAATETWTYQEVPIHGPVWDRPWIGIVPGPVNAPGGVADFVSFIHGGTAGKEPLLYSTDGLTYLTPSSPNLDQQLMGGSFEGALETLATEDFDWMQGSGFGFTPLGDGKALATVGPSGWALFDGAAFEWMPYRLEGGDAPEGIFEVDSAGRIHNILPVGAAFQYRISTDGGATWKSTTVKAAPPGGIQYDFKVNLAAGVGAVAMHTTTPEGTDVDLVFKFDITGDTARLVRRYQVGLGDFDASSGLGANVRFDFDSLAIFPDGRIAVSFLDSTTRANSLTMGELIGPALAIELTTKLGAKLPPPPEPPPPPAGIVPGSYRPPCQDTV